MPLHYHHYHSYLLLGFLDKSFESADQKLINHTNIINTSVLWEWYTPGFIKMSRCVLWGQWKLQHESSLQTFTLFLETLQETYVAWLCDDLGSHIYSPKPLQSFCSQSLQWWSYDSLAAGVAIISWSATVSLMQCPSTSTHTGTGARFADLGRMTGWVNPLVY